jgi:hypothetical protein
MDQLNRERGLIFENIKGQCYQRLSAAAGIGHVGQKYSRRIGRVARRGKRMLSNSLPFANDLTAEQRREAFGFIAKFGVIAYLSRRSVSFDTDEEPMQHADPLTPLQEFFARRGGR